MVTRYRSPCISTYKRRYKICYIIFVSQTFAHPPASVYSGKQAGCELCQYSSDLDAIYTKLKETTRTV